MSELPIYIGRVISADPAVGAAIERRPVDPRDIWTEVEDIPAIPPPLEPWPGSNSDGIVHGISGVPLTAIRLRVYGFQGDGEQQFRRMVPGVAYRPILRDSSRKIVPYNPAIWVADGTQSIVEFSREPTTLGYMPPFTIDYWQYAGGVGVGTGGATAAGTNLTPPEDPDRTAGSVFAQTNTDTGELEFRTLTAAAGSGISLNTTDTTVAVRNTMVGTNTAAGAGIYPVFVERAGSELRFNPLRAGDGISIETHVDGGLTLSAGGVLTGVVNEGAGIDICSGVVDGVAQIRSLVAAGDGLTITANDTVIELTNTLTGMSLGDGAAVYTGQTGNTLQFRSIVADEGSGVAVTSSSDSILLRSTIMGFNRGDGVPLYSTKAEDQLWFNTLAAGTGVTITAPDDEGVIAISAPGSSLHGEGGISVFAGQLTGELQFRGIKAGANIEATTDDQDITISANALTGESLHGEGAVPVYVDRTPAGLRFRGIKAGQGIGLASSSTDITVSVTAPAIWTIVEKRAIGVLSHAGASFGGGEWHSRILTDMATGANNIDGTTPGIVFSPNGDVPLVFGPGYYRVTGSCPTGSTGINLAVDFVGPHQTRLYNVSADSTLVLGTSETGGNTRSFIEGTFVIEDENTTVEIQHRRVASIGGIPEGFGLPAGFGDEIYTVLTFELLGAGA
jgi:hypothetical protein